jgi:hypothetical protein
MGCRTGNSGTSWKLSEIEQMKSQPLGASTSEVEVLNIDRHGLWLYVAGAEYFLAYEKYPWFQDAKVSEVLHVELLHERHLHWPELDVDLSLESLKRPEASPLTYR